MGEHPFPENHDEEGQESPAVSGDPANGVVPVVREFHLQQAQSHCEWITQHPTRTVVAGV